MTEWHDERYELDQLDASTEAIADDAPSPSWRRVPNHDWTAELPLREGLMDDRERVLRQRLSRVELRAGNLHFHRDNLNDLADALKRWVVDIPKDADVYSDETMLSLLDCRSALLALLEHIDNYAFLLRAAGTRYMVAIDKHHPSKTNTNTYDEEIN